MAGSAWIETAWRAPDGRRIRTGESLSKERRAELKRDGNEIVGYYVGWREPGTTKKSYQSFGKAEDARSFRTQKERDLQTGTPVPKADRRQSFGAFAERVLRESRSIAPSTADWYAYHYDRHVKPKLGGLPIEAVTTAKLREFFDSLHAKVERTDDGRLKNAGTVTAVRRVLVKVLNAAVAEGLFPKGSPMAPLRGTFRKPPRKKVTPLSVETVEALADTIEPRYRLAVLLAAYAGLRGGEVGGLRLQDVKLRDKDGNLVDDPMLTVEQAVRTVRAHAEIAEPKTEASRRSVGIPGFLVTEIDNHVAEFGTADDGRLFESLRNGGLVSHFTLDKALAAAAERLGIDKPRFHDLRHTCAALMIEQGVHPKAIQERMRHASIQVTFDTYGHLLPGRDQDIARGLDAKRTEILRGRKLPELVGQVVEPS